MGETLVMCVSTEKILRANLRVVVRLYWIVIFKAWVRVSCMKLNDKLNDELHVINYSVGVQKQG